MVLRARLQRRSGRAGRESARGFRNRWIPFLPWETIRCVLPKSADLARAGGPERREARRSPRKERDPTRAPELSRSRFPGEEPAPRQSLWQSTSAARCFAREPRVAAQRDCCKQKRIPSRRAGANSPSARNARVVAGQADIAPATPRPFQEKSADSAASRQNNSPAQARKKER